MGFTEIVLRLIQFFCFTRYAGYNVGIMAGTNGRLAHKDLRRFARLFKNIPVVVEQWIKSNTMELVNGTHIEAFPASEEAMTGLERYKCVFEDEKAKWRIVDDSPVSNSIVPIIESSGGDSFLVSTPKGPIKTFYKIHDDPDSDYDKLGYFIWECLDNLYTREEIERKLARKDIDPNQEYLGKFTIGDDSILGAVTAEDRGKGWTTWDDADYDDDDEEDDDYDESNEDFDTIMEPEAIAA